MTARGQLPVRMRAKITPAPCLVGGLKGDCWLWTGGDNGLGYGRIAVDRRWWYTHRLAYTLLVGPIPAGLELDHRCRVPACANPDHLEPVTHGENMARGLKGWRKSQCDYGHDLVGHNRLERKRGRYVIWECRACINAHQNRRRAAARAAREQAAS